MEKFREVDLNNGSGIATVADLRASSLSAVTKDQADQRSQNYHQDPLLWHTMLAQVFYI
jgi:hypothetical protein